MTLRLQAFGHTKDGVVLAYSNNAFPDFRSLCHASNPTNVRAGNIVHSVFGTKRASKAQTPPTAGRRASLSVSMWLIFPRNWPIWTESVYPCNALNIEQQFHPCTRYTYSCPSIVLLPARREFFAHRLLIIVFLCQPMSYWTRISTLIGAKAHRLRRASLYTCKSFLKCDLSPPMIPPCRWR